MVLVFVIDEVRVVVVAEAEADPLDRALYVNEFRAGAVRKRLRPDREVTEGALLIAEADRLDKQGTDRSGVDGA
ncbi:hypothetical protein ACPW96_19335 [Micromonospora sp. DT81.3]|uniref:hypothetical protein n=1 Tax=Micromonospora sp. DT81.3 TaxID=3416523 RepID=UPI003CF66822